MQANKQQQTSSKLRKEDNKAVHCHPAYLACMQSISCEMPGWMTHKMEPRLLEEISTTSDMQMWRAQQWPQDSKRSILIPIPKKGSTKECSNHQTITFISHASMVMLKILQARLQDYMKRTSRCSRWV